MKSTEASAYGSFEFPFGPKLIESTKEFLSKLAWVPLAEQNVKDQFGSNQKTLGVYLLGLQDLGTGAVRIMYVGQSEKALYTRLLKHARYILDRKGLNPGHVMFKAAEIVMLSSMKIEAQVIKDYGTKWSGKNPNCGWNGSGFGSNDTGGNRDEQRASAFDTRHPIDITLLKPGMFQLGKTTVKSAIESLRLSVPYTVRIAPSSANSSDLLSEMEIEDTNYTAADAAKKILQSLPDSWCAKVFVNKIVFEHGSRKPSPLFDETPWPMSEPFKFALIVK